MCFNSGRKYRNMSLKQEVGERLKRLRESAEISQKKMAEILDTNQSAITRYENGVCEPDLQTLLNYGVFFKVSTDWILGRTQRKMEGTRLGDLEEEINEDSPFYKTLQNAIAKIMENYKK